MTELFDSPQSLLKLTPGEIEQLRHAIPRGPHDRGTRNFLKSVSDAQLTDAEYLRRGYHAHVGGCKKLTEPRLRAAVDRLYEGYSVDEIDWAIVTYAIELKKDKWRLENPMAKRSFESFLNGDRFEFYVEKGQRHKVADLEQRQSADNRRRENARAQYWGGLLDIFVRKPKDLQGAMIHKAVELLGGTTKIVGAPTMANLLVRNTVLKLIQKEQRNQAAPSIGQALEESMS